MYLKLLLVTLVFVFIAFLLLALKTIVLKNGVFPNTSVGGNKKLRQMGITCVKCEEQTKYNRIRRNKAKLKINPAELSVVLD